MSSRRILIIGGSTRAAADSVRRAGWQPVCADLFADYDLRMTSEVIPVKHYPQSLPDDLADVEADGWFYCGALENHPNLLSRIITQNSSCGPLLGMPPTALKFLRDPVWLANVLKDAGIAVLEIRREIDPPPSDGTWIQKPIASAGGRAIRIWDESAEQTPIREPHYFQRRAAGIPLSAVFRIKTRKIECLGLSQELEPSQISHPPSQFSYCGSIGPLEKLTDNHVRDRQIIQGQSNEDSQHLSFKEIEKTLLRIVSSLIERAPEAKGLMGIDFRFDGQNVWVTEVNPRYTASIEVLELATGRSFLNKDYVTTPRVTPMKRQSTDGFEAGSHPVIAKQILYASKKLQVPDITGLADFQDHWNIPMIADVPCPGSVIQSGWPICTVFASGLNESEVRTQLKFQISQLTKILDEQCDSIPAMPMNSSDDRTA